MMAMMAAKTGVEQVCAFMTLRANRPRPRIRFSASNSGTTRLTLAILTRLAIPVMGFGSASKESRWYSVLDLPEAAAACRAQGRAGRT